MNDHVICYDGTYIWFLDKPEVKVFAKYEGDIYCDVNHRDIKITNIQELINAHVV